MRHPQTKVAMLISAFIVVVMAALMPATALAKPQECKIVNQSSDEKFDGLQQAVDAASPGDILKLKGTCIGASTISKDLTIIGQSNPAYGIATLDAQGAAKPTLQINSGNVTLEGLTITGGTGFGPLGGGGIMIFFCGGCTVTVSDSEVSGNTALGGGGGIFNFGGNLILDNSTVKDNTAGTGAGMAASCGFMGGSVTLNNSTISDNHSTSIGIAGGGGMFTQTCTTTLNNTVVSGNSAVAYGGGIAPFNGSLILNNSTISDNSAGVEGGGLYTVNNPVTLDATTIFSGNTPDDCAGTSCP